MLKMSILMHEYGLAKKDTSSFEGHGSNKSGKVCSQGGPFYCLQTLIPPRLITILSVSKKSNWLL